MSNITSSGSYEWQQPPASQTKVLADTNMVLKILLNGGSTEPRLGHKIFMMEACDVRLGGISRKARDELRACLLWAMGQLFGTGQHREATEILVEHIMLVSPGADREKMVAGCKFDQNDQLVDWNLKLCKISRLPETFGALVCTQHLNLSANKLQSLFEGFLNITVGGSLDLSGNQLQSLPDGFANITVGRNLNLSYNQLRSLPDGFGNITVGMHLSLVNNELTEAPSSFPNVKGTVVQERRFQR